MSFHNPVTITGENYASVDTNQQITLNPVNLSNTNVTGQLSATSVGTGTVDNTEFGYLNGVTSAIQTQLNSKATDFTAQTANTVFSGPASAGPSIPTFRSLVTADLPITAVTPASYPTSGQIPTFTVDAKGRLTAAGSTVSGSGITSLGTIASGTWNATAIDAAHGGTGQTSYTVGDILYASGSTALSKLSDVATGNSLISGGVTTAPSWGKIGLTTHISGTLAIGNGGTNITSYAVGDLLYASGSTTLSKLADVAAGSYLRSGGVTTAPVWSTTTLPNSATTGDLLYASASNTYSNLGDVATGNALISGGVSTAPSWGKVGLTTHVSGVLPEANGGTNQSTYAQGNILYASAANTLSKLAKDTNATRYLSNTGSSNNPAWAQVDLSNGVTGTLPSGNGGAITPNIQVFTSSGTWTNPGTGTFVRVIMFGGGGGGGSGARRAAAAYGGGGGAGGCKVDTVIKRLGFGSSETVTVGAAGAAGAAVTADNTDGNNGTDGGTSSVGVGNFSTIIYAGGGPKGLGGTATTGTGGTGGGFGMFPGGNGGSAGAVAGGAAPFVYNAAPGGGSGGSWNGVSPGNGGIGTTDNILGGWYANGGAPGVAGDAGWGGGGPGTQWLGNGGVDIFFPGGGGGGGGANSGGAAAGAGGAGQLYGAGGGGGGANSNGANSGVGGVGAKGLVVMITY